MHDLLIALAFIGMVVAPAVVAAKSGTSETKLDEFSPIPSRIARLPSNSECTTDRNSRRISFGL